jgi:hypothetical protein
MFKILITVALILILTTSIYSQVDARFGGFGGGGFRGFGGFGGGGGKSFSSHSVPLGTGQGKTFTTSPSGKISPPPQETTQSASKQSTPSSSSSSSGSNNPQNNFQPLGPQSQFQQQPRSGFFGGGFGGGGLGGFGSMLMSSIMGNFIGQALFGWMFPHPAQVVAPAPAAPSPSAVQAPAQKIVNNTVTTNNSTFKTPYQDQQFSSSSIKK